MAIENFICVQCGTQFAEKRRSRRHAVQFAKMNGNLFVTAARNGRRSNGWRLIITTASKKKRRAFWASAPNRNLR